MRVMYKIGRPRSGSPICLITSVITDRIGRHEVLLPINHNFNKICDILGSFFLSKHKKRVMARIVQLLRYDAYCPI